MEERPILFKDEMVRAILEGRKTQTRRIVKSRNVLDSLNDVGVWDGPAEQSEWELSRCPYGKVGDQLWVREAFAKVPHTCMWRDLPTTRNGNWRVYYRAGFDRSPVSWKPSIHMPRWASRITLEVKNVRVERLQAITEDDAIAEGIARLQDEIGKNKFSVLIAKENRHRSAPTAREVFIDIWESINGVSSWDANPWVWVIEFERLNDNQEGAATGR